MSWLAVVVKLCDGFALYSQLPYVHHQKMVVRSQFCPLISRATPPACLSQRDSGPNPMST